MLRTLLLACLIASGLAAQSQSLEIVLERNQNSAWKTVDPGLVLGQGDLVRFRFRTTFDGYLYVINSGTSGAQSLLFPSDATGRNNRVHANQDYFVPSTGASFKVAGPAGHDIVYWVVSPVPLDGNPAAALGRTPVRKPAGTLVPRCDQPTRRPRAVCIDPSGEPRNVGAGEPLPEAL